MKIDLHCHTKAIKKGDGIGRNVTPDLFKSKIEDADIKIVAITNHNAFDINQYRALSSAVEGLCQVWPGVEIDVLEPESKRWHLIVVVNPKEVESFSANVNILFKDDKLEEFSGCFLSFFGNGALILSWQRFSLIKTAVLYIMLA